MESKCLEKNAVSDEIVHCPENALPVHNEMEASKNALPETKLGIALVTAGFLGLGKLMTVKSTVGPRDVIKGKATPGGKNTKETFPV